MALRFFPRDNLHNLKNATDSLKPLIQRRRFVDRALKNLQENERLNNKPEQLTDNQKLWNKEAFQKLHRDFAK